MALVVKSREVIVALSLPFGYVCNYCGVALSDEWGQPNRSAIDHINPRFRGGNDDLENLRLACRSCNSRKSHSTLEDFRARVWFMDNLGLRLSPLTRSAIEKYFNQTFPVHEHKFYFETAPTK